MQKLLTPTLAAISALIAILTFAFSYLTLHDLEVPLAVLGCIWFAAVLALVCHELLTVRRGEGSSVSVGLSVFFLVLAIGVGVDALLGESISGVEFDKFSWLQVNGIVGIAIAVGIAIFELNRRYSAQFKKCPDCAEEVRKTARVCKWCAHAWSADELAERAGATASG
jgi:predicted MFS family arabinose efflux permease